MAEVVPYGRRTQRPPDVPEVHVIWMTGGLSCDGDSVSVTAATQPSLEDVLLGAIPGLPTVHLHNPVLAYENGDDFMTYWYRAERGELDGPEHPPQAVLALHLLVQHPHGFAREERALGHRVSPG